MCRCWLSLRYVEIDALSCSEKEELRSAGQVFLDSSDQSEHEDERAKQRLVCVPCRKTFKSLAQMAEHSKSKKHLQTCRKLKVDPKMDPSLIKEKNDYSETKSADHTQCVDKRFNSVMDRPHFQSSVASSNSSDIQDSPRSLSQGETKLGEELAQIDAPINTRQLSSKSSVSSSASEGDFIDLGYSTYAKSEKRVDQLLDDSDEEVASHPVDIPNGKTKHCEKHEEAKSKRRRRAKPSGPTAAPVWKCLMCSATFPTRNQLMQHVKKEGHAALKTEALKQSGGKKRR